MATTEAENKEKARRFVEEVFGGGKLDLLDEVVAEDFVGRNNAAPEPIRGREELEKFITMNRAGFPDIEFTVEDSIAEADKVVEKTHVTGTHNGEFMGIEPTGEEIDIQTIGIFRFEDGQIVEEFGRIDMMGLMQQLGVAETPGE